MSLINEALKRSESDKLRNSSPYFNNLTVMMPEGDEVPPPPRPTFEKPRPPRRPTSRLLILALAATACFGAWYSWGRSTGQVGPASASGESAQEQEMERPLTLAQMQAAAQRSAPDASLDRHNTDSQAHENAAAKSGAKGGITASNVEDAFTAAMRKLQQARQQEQAEESAGQADEATSTVTAPAETTETPSNATPAAPSPAAAPVKPAPAPAAPSPAAAPAKPATETSDDPDPSKLRVTAIMRGPDGNVALINGGLYREGQTIQGATILKIGQYEVELTANGKRFTIRI